MSNTLLKHVVDQKLLDYNLEQHYIKRGFHPKFDDLRIYNYTPIAQFASEWNDATNLCRGLITRVINGEEVIWARPFSKFHNINTSNIPETHFENLPKDILPEISDKLDGSMGIHYHYEINGKESWYVATRGSFVSDQAIWATNWIQNHIKNLEKDKLGWVFAGEGSTLISEIIYPENRIVLDYGSYSGLRPLAVIKNDTGLAVSRHDLEIICNINNLVPVDVFDKTLDECLSENTPNVEGYVLTYPNGLRVKVKFEEYCRIHRMVTGLNPKSVWEKLSSGDVASVDAMLADQTLSAGFRDWLGDWKNHLTNQYNEIENAARKIFAFQPYFTDNSSEKASRKDVAMYFQKPENKEYSTVCFKMLDGSDYSNIIWKMIKPKADDTFRADGEE